MQSCHILDLVVEPTLFEEKNQFSGHSLHIQARVLLPGVERHGGADWHLQENVSENQQK